MFQLGCELVDFILEITNDFSVFVLPDVGKVKLFCRLHGLLACVNTAGIGQTRTASISFLKTLSHL